MKNIYSFLVIIFFTFSFNSYSQTNLYTQDFGTGAACVSDWTVSPAAGSYVSCASTAPTSSGYIGASSAGWSQLRNPAPGSIEATYTMDPISTVGFSSITILWGARKSSTGTQPTYVIEWSTNGSSWTNIAFTDVSNDDVWALVNSGTRIALPAGADGATTLYFRFRWTSTNSTASYRIDDFTVEGSCGEPTVNAQLTTTFNLQSNQTGLAWTNGNGFKRIVIMRQGAAVTFVPTDLNTYTADANFSTATDLGSGNKCVYNGTNSNTFVSGLTSATDYYVAIYEYGCGAGFENYLTTSPETYNFITCDGSQPTTQPSAVNKDETKATSLNFTWTNGDGSNRLFTLSTAIPSGLPVDGTSYITDNTFANGQDVVDGFDEWAMYNATGSSVSVTNLQGGTNYYYSLFEFNCEGNPDYLTTAPTTGMATTCGAPSNEPTGNTETAIGTTTATINWSLGVGSTNTLLVVGTAPITGDPINGTQYTTSLDYSAATTVSAVGEYGIYNSTGTSAAITNLSVGITYYYKLFSFNDCTSEPQYYTSTTTTGTFTTCGDPTKDPTGYSASNIGLNSADLTWTLGADASNTIIILKEASAVNATPTDNTTYTADNNFSGSPEALGDGFVVYYNTGTSVSLTGLNSGTTYHYSMYSYNDCSGTPQYTATTTAIGSFTTCATPTGDPSAHSASNIGLNSADLTWTLGTGASNTLIVLKEASAVNATPTDNTTYTPDANFSGTPEALGDGSVIYTSTGTSVSISGLNSGTTYHYIMYSFDDCNGSPKYTATTTAIGSFTTCSSPTDNPATYSVSNIGLNSADLSWVLGVGSTNTLVVLKQGSAVDVTPTDNTTYSADNNFSGTPQNLGSFNFAMYNSTGTSVSIIGLSPSTTYHYALYSFDDCSGVPQYTPSTTAIGSFTTCGDPTGNPTNISATNVGQNSADLSWTLGTASTNTIVILKASSAVNATPTDNTTYTADLNFSGSPEALGDGFVIYNSTATSATISGLTSGTTYHYAMYSFDDCSGTPQYTPSTTAIGSFTTCNGSTPTIQTDNIVVDPSGAIQLAFSWAGSTGDGDFRIMAVSTSPVTGLPVNGTIYTADNQYNNGQDILSAGEYITYNGSGNAVTVTGLTENTNYYYAFFEYNCELTPSYLSPATTGMATTCGGPSDDATNVSVTNILETSADLSWTKGLDADNTIIILREASAVGSSPVDGTDYLADANFTSGDDISGGSGEYVMYDGVDVAGLVSFTGLTANTTYHYLVVSFDQCGTNFQYKSTGVTGSFTTCSSTNPSTVTSLGAKDETAATKLGFTFALDGDGSNRLFVLSSAAVTGSPVNTSVYNPDLTYNNSQDVLNAGEYIMFNGTGASFTVSGLNPSTTYNYSIFEFNCELDPKYLTTAITSGTATTCGAPSNDPTANSESSITSESAILSWTQGVGSSNSLVVMSTALIAGTPVNSPITSYTASPTFGSGSTIAAGEYVMYNSTGTSLTVTGLDASTTYYYSIFSFNDCSSEPQYDQTTTAIGSFTTNAAYYSINGADLSLLSGWNSNIDEVSGSAPAAFNITATDFYVNDASSQATSGTLTINGASSRFIIRTGSDYTVNSGNTLNATVYIEGTGTLNINDATNPSLNTLSSTSTVSYGATSTVEPFTYANLTINSAVNLGGDAIVNSVLLLNDVLSLNGNQLTLNSSVNPASTSTINGSSTSKLVVSGSGSSNTITLGPDVSLSSLTISRAGQNIPFGSDITIANSGTMTLTSGNLDLNGNSLTFEDLSTVSGAGTGFIVGDVASNVTVNGTSPALGTLRFITDRNLNNLVINRDVTINSDLTIGTNGGMLNLNSSILTLSATRTLTLNGDFQTVTGTIKGSSTSNITLSGSGAMTNSLLFDQTTPGTTNLLGTLTMNRPSEEITIGNNLVIASALTITSGILNTGGNVISESGSPSLSIAAGARLNVSGSGTFPTITNVTLNTDSEVEYSGTSDIANQNYQLLYVTGSAVTLGASGASLIQDMTVSGTLDMQGNLFKLISNSSGTAAILPVTGTINGATNVQHQRYTYQASGTKWRLVGSPINDGTIEQLENSGLTISGLTGSNYPPPTYTFASVLSYTEANATTNMRDGYTTPSSTSETFNQTNGYIAYTANNNMPRNYVTQGTLQVGGFTVSGLTNSGNGSGVSGFHMIGNPYPAPIDVANLNVNPGTSNITAYYKLNESTGGWSSSPGTPMYISSGEAFFAETSGGGSIEFQEDDKVSSSNEQYNSRQGSVLDILNVRLVKNAYYDETKLVLDPNGTINFDKGLDARKLNNINASYMNIALVSNDNENMAFLGLNDTTSYRIPIRVYKETPNNTNYTFTLELNNVSDILENKCVYFENTLTSETFPLLKDTSFSVTIYDTVTTPKMFININKGFEFNSTCSSFGNGSISVINNNNYDIVWKDNSGNVIDQNTAELNNLESGYYTLEATSSNLNCPSINTSIYVKSVNESTIDVTTSGSSIICEGSNNGTTEVIPVDQPAEYNYLWNNGVTTTINSGLEAGIHVVSVSDSDNCIKEYSFEILNSNAISISEETNIAPICFNTTDGFIKIISTNSNYSYMWNNGSTISEISNLSAGAYSLTVTNPDMCTSIFEYLINEYDQITPSFDVNNDTIYIEDGAYLLITNNATGATDYEWNFGDGTTSNNISPWHQYSSEGTYEISLKAINDNCYETSSKTVVVMKTTGINDIENKNINIYNNGNRVIVQSKFINEKITLNVFNEMGQIIEQKQVNLSNNFETELSVSNGIYLINLKGENIDVTKKVNIIK